MNRNDAEKIRQKFIEDYIFQEPYNEYVQGVGDVKTIRVFQEQNNKQIDLGKSESLDDFCFEVLIKKIPPNDLGLPEKNYKGVRLIYGEPGEIIPLSNH